MAIPLAERFKDKNRSKVEEKGQELFKIYHNGKTINNYGELRARWGMFVVPLGGMITGSGANLSLLMTKNSVE